MITMSVEVLDELEQVCRSNIGYRACIYCESSIRALAIQEALLTAWHGTSFDRYFGGGLAVRFPDTNSVVRIMEPQDLRTAQLYSCHTAIVDRDVRITYELAQKFDEITVPYGPPRSHDWWVADDSEYTIFFENGSSITTIPKVPDYGEISPSSEILEYIGGING